MVQASARVFGAVLLAGALTSGRSSSAADAITSVYTNFDADKCRHKAGVEPEGYGVWRCPGYKGSPVLLSAGDQRMYVSYGQGSGGDFAASQTFPGFNDVYKGAVEWRLEKIAAGKRRPLATILRWNVMTASDVEGATGPAKATGRVLVVTRLGPGGVCHIGYVDARANPDANQLAREIADEHARSFRCGKDKRIVRGIVSPGLAMPRDPE
ncbi:hypothetical protein [Methylocella silvestris]|uniref:hypothetical protein n=1 Tax=Methylocella silvestris TaxID=199596 RepID=UPI001FDF4990|nr:hypothetical protein [Methylocella silvestris]